MKVDANGDFVLGNGKSVRFWAVNTSVGREKLFVPRPLWSKVEPDLAHHARFLAKRGVNMVRCHAHLNPEPGGKLTAFDQTDCDWIWRTVAAMKKEGIYTTISPFWATAKVGPSWGIPGVTKSRRPSGCFSSTQPCRKATSPGSRPCMPRRTRTPASRWHRIRLWPSSNSRTRTACSSGHSTRSPASRANGWRSYSGTSSRPSTVLWTRHRRPGADGRTRVTTLPTAPSPWTTSGS